MKKLINLEIASVIKHTHVADLCSIFSRSDHLKGQYEQMHLRLAGQLTHDELEKNRDLNDLRTTMEREQVK